MRDDDYMADLPEALPAEGVAPAWRVVAIVEMIGLAILLLVSFALLMALVVQMERRAVAVKQTAKVANPPIQVQAAADEDNEGLPGNPVDQGNLPYPVKEDSPPVAQPELPARKRFLQQGQEVWKSPANQYPTSVVVSPDGQQIAYIANTD